MGLGSANFGPFSSALSEGDEKTSRECMGGNLNAAGGSLEIDVAEGRVVEGEEGCARGGSKIRNKNSMSVCDEDCGETPAKLRRID